ncbi:uncharacterized protein LOC142803128 [Rhipicephalus microplus]|uniref:uncharacterized protein LOC142803128 n=1 Tax=Rhipicephalus microplus TaxID=6941 RepID=UPI003F6BC939
MAGGNMALCSRFGIHAGRHSKPSTSCVHPCDPARQLWFTPDVPHLLKNLRNYPTSGQAIYLPDEVVQKHKLPTARVDLAHRSGRCESEIRGGKRPEGGECRYFQNIGALVTVAQLHKLLDNEKSKWKKKQSEEKRNLYATGGGPATCRPMIPSLALVGAAASHMGTRLQNPYDSDGVHLNQPVLSLSPLRIFESMLTGSQDNTEELLGKRRMGKNCQM